MRLFPLAIAWLLGLILGRWLHLDWALLLGLASLLLLAGVVTGRRWQPGIAAIYAAALLLGMLRLAAQPSAASEASLQLYNGPDSVTLRGIVADDPDPRQWATFLRVDTTEIEIDGEWQPVKGKALVYAPAYPDLQSGRAYPYYRYGDLLQMKGILQEPPAFPDFNYRDYLARQGVFSLMRQPQQVKLLATNRGFTPLALIYDLRQSLSRSLERALPEPQAALARGILLGQRSGIPSSLQDDFNRTGTSHVVAISGQNLTIVLALLAGVAAWALGRHRPYYLILSLVVIGGYSLLVGMPASVARAALMGTLWLLAQYLGRPGAAGSALALSAAVMAGLDPSILGDVSFQLSFAAMAGIIYLAPRFQKAANRLWKAEGARLRPPILEAASVTLAATLATVPIIALTFGRASLVGIPATLFALPSLPGIIITSALTAGLGNLWPGAAQAMGWLAWLFLTYLIKVVELFAALPGASLTVRTSTPTVMAYYVLLGGAVWLTGRPKLPTLSIAAVKGRLALLSSNAGHLPLGKMALALLPVAALVWIATLTLPDGRTHVYFLDVGQGDAALIRTASGQNVLIDGGPAEGRLAQQVGRRLPFWNQGIDLMVVSHFHEDHVAGLVEVLRRQSVARVLDVGWEEQTAPGSSYDELRKLVKENGIEYLRAQSGQAIKLDKDLRLEVLHPPRPRFKVTEEYADDNSVVLRLVDGEVSFLFTGDLHATGEDYLLDQGTKVGSTVLKVGHHGSATSTSSRFLAAVSPQVAVISAGKDNPFGHPNSEVVARLHAKVGDVNSYQTKDRGTLELITDGRRLWVKAER